MAFEDLLEHFHSLEDRTRLFGDDGWSVAKCWARVQVPWIDAYQNTIFTFTLDTASKVVFVLAQLDARYYKGLQGRYTFSLDFLVRRVDNGKDEYIVSAS